MLNLLPIRFSEGLASGISAILYRVLPKRKRIALANLDIAYGNSIPLKQKEAIARKSLHHFVISLIEFFRIPAMLKDAAQRFTFEGTEFLDQAFARGHGIILVISHLGSWEYLAFLPFLRGYPCSVVVRRVKNPYIYEWIQKLRIKTKLNPIDRKSSVREILRELRQNHLVAILIDQWAGQEGIWIDFFGEPTSTTSIPVRLAIRTQAALIPAYCLRTGCGQYRIVIKPEVAIQGEEQEREEKTTFALNHLLEKEILKHPEQWTWSHRRWKSQSRHKANVSAV